MTIFQVVSCLLLICSFPHHHAKGFVMTTRQKRDNTRGCGGCKLLLPSSGQLPTLGVVGRGGNTVSCSLARNDQLFDIGATQTELDWNSLGDQMRKELSEVGTCVSVATQVLFQADSSVEPNDIVTLCDELDALQTDDDLFVSRELALRQKALEFRRHEMLVKLMRSNYDAYVKTASFLSPSRISRDQLPNVQDIPFVGFLEESSRPPFQPNTFEEAGVPLVADCELEDMEYKDSWLDSLLLSIFRKLVEQNTGGVTSSKDGILGLLEQGRSFMLQPGQTPEAQHSMVYQTLKGLLTPFLPPFYRIFMSGIVPNLGTKLDGKQLGPWFYAPFLTACVTPPFFAFLVGPSRPNRRKDGQLGGLLVEKCKFLQESGCKGLCLHQCKLPAQQFFRDELGMALTVTPNFVTQECQWSFGEQPIPPDQDPYFPKGCLVGCESRKAVAGTKADLCNY